MRIYGEILKIPQLRFDYSSTYAVDYYSKSGLRSYGPYDSSQFEKSVIRCGIIYPKNLTKLKQILIEGLTKGEGNYTGFQSLFQIPLSFEEEITWDNGREEQILQNIAKRELDIVFILLRSKTNLYGTIKKILLGNGIPCQVILAEKLQRTFGRQWILENISLATYAKIGGTPWVVANPMQENQLILGISRAKDKSKRYLIGFVTLFTQDGDFILLHSKAPVIEWEEYVEGLTKLIGEAIVEYNKIKGIPNSIIVHIHKKPGWKELDAIENALKNIEKDIPYALLHLNEYSNFRLFDTSHQSFIPPKGLKVNISKYEAILLIDGRINRERRKVGVPRVLDIRMDKRSTLSSDNFPYLVKQVYDFAHVNWRGFNAAAIPITINYSKLIARMVAEIGADSWNQIIASGKLRDKAWFL